MRHVELWPLYGHLLRLNLRISSDAAILLLRPLASYISETLAGTPERASHHFRQASMTSTIILTVIVDSSAYVERQKKLAADLCYELLVIMPTLFQTSPSTDA
jgi:hypothetical protein